VDRRIVPLIMCGGAGTRLWPASREVHPKQFLPLFGARSTFQNTLLRVSDTALFERPIVITNKAYRFMVLEQLAEIGLEADVLLEPMRRDSGPAIAAGAAFAQMRDNEAIVLALTSRYTGRGAHISRSTWANGIRSSAHRREAGRPAVAAETSPSFRALDRGTGCCARDRQRTGQNRARERIVHRLENPGKIPLELIEVQTGSYLGEDDIIRIEDDYQRS
jgi:Nucleotidyl transferase/Mannose-6-phosphate isomerase